MATGDDEPMRDAPAPKPRRRFAPQLVEETVKTSSSRWKAESNTAQASAAAVPEPHSSAPGSATRTAIPTPTTRTTRDASVQVDDVEMGDAPPPPPKNKKPARRFAPEPIETTFNTNRTTGNPHGPTAEPTPDPSPTTPQPPSILINGPEDPWQQSQQPHQQTEPAGQNKNENTEKKPKRRFAPQLIETSRRARRTGQEGPATKPTDKTDITPGTNHIYAPRPKRKILGAICAVGPRPSMSGAVVVAESEDDDDTLEGSPRFLTPRRQQSMKPHPNTRRGTKSSFIPDLDTIMSSESESSSEENDDEAPGEPSPMMIEKVPPVLPDSRTPEGDLWNGMRHELRERRESCDEEISGYLLAVAAKEAFRQRQIEQVMSAFPNGLPPAGVEHFVAHDNSEDEDYPEPPGEPSGQTVSQLVRRKSTDPGWAVREMRAHAEKLANMRAQRRPSVDMDVDQMDLPPPQAPLWTADGTKRGELAPSPALRAKDDSKKPQDGSPMQQKQKQAEGAIQQVANPFGLPSGFRGVAAAEEEEDDEAVQLRKMRQAASPPMLGKDLVFRRCQSPQLTRIQPNHPYSELRDANRDATGGGGLWGGYCAAKPGAESTATTKKKVSGLWGGFCTMKANQEVAAMLHPSAFLSTPAEPVTPSDVSASMLTPQPSACSSRQSTRQQPAVAGTAVNGCLAPGPGPGAGLHMFSAGLDERLRKEKARKELEERIQQEFDDAFVTQVYNYISLGYPATARAFDDELSKISGIEIEQLRKDDRLSVGKGFMLEMELAVKKAGGSVAGSRASSGGEDDDDEVMLTPEEDERRHRNKPPRWRALKLYIREWARQHPSFDDGFGEDENPLAWGVRARRGSWAI